MFTEPRFQAYRNTIMICSTQRYLYSLMGASNYCACGFQAERIDKIFRKKNISVGNDMSCVRTCL